MEWEVKMVRFLAAAVLCLAFISTTVPAKSSDQNPTVEVFEVRAQVYSGGRLVGRPTLQINEGGEAVIAITELDGYALRVQVRPAEAGRGGPGRLALTGALHFPDGQGGWALAGRPSATLAPGAVVAVNVSGQNGRGDYRVVYDLRRTGRTVLLSDLKTLEDCPVYRSVVLGEPTLVNVSAQSGDAEIGGDSNCCKGGPVTCCGTSGSCCFDDNLPGRPGCCLP